MGGCTRQKGQAVTYDIDFYQEEGRVALDAARIVLPWLLDQHPARTLIDVGCGVGSWVTEAQQLGLVAVGVDLVPMNWRHTPHIIQHDLIRGFPCTNYDIALCLEVAEHLPPDTAQRLVEGLAKAGVVLFSAATPGQPGIGHIHCQPHDYWHRLFAEHGMTPTHIGPLFAEPVADFYRRNMFLYEHS